MLNPLSPSLSDLFMNKTDSHLQSKGLFLTICIRLIDDTFTISHKNKVEERLEIRNKTHRNFAI